MKLCPRKDGNHAAVVEALRLHGWSVADTASLGGGFPDLVVGKGKLNLLLEVKDGGLSPSRRRLTEDEAVFHHGWRGTVVTVLGPDDAVAKCRTVLELATIKGYLEKLCG